jgi:3D (Asp-Asp-Asp) domain-containing protein
LGTTTRLPARPSRPGRAFSPLYSGLLPSVCLGLSLVASVAYTAPAVRLFVDGRTVTVSDSVRTVRAALAEARVTLDADDQVTPDLDAPVPASGTIRVSRVTYSEGSQEVKLPYRTTVRPATRTQRPYHPTITQEGRTGLKRVKYRAKLVDGQEVERSTVDEEIVREPQDRVVTSRKPYQLASRGAYAGIRTLKVLTSAYDPGPGSCGKWAKGGVTCNGKRAGYGIIAVDPKMIPLGTKMYVPGYGHGIAADVGGAIKGNRLDLGFNSRSGAMQWGKRWLTIQILD